LTIIIFSDISHRKNNKKGGIFMMVKDKLDFYKDLLLKEKENIIKELIENNESAKEILENEKNNVNDSIDEANSIISQNILNIMETKQKQTLMAIEAALKRIEEGSLGFCISCGNEISEQRLSVIPWATKCLECKTKEEKAKHHN